MTRKWLNGKNATLFCITCGLGGNKVMKTFRRKEMEKPRENEAVKK